MHMLKATQTQKTSMVIGIELAANHLLRDVLQQES